MSLAELFRKSDDYGSLEALLPAIYGIAAGRNIALVRWAQIARSRSCHPSSDKNGKTLSREHIHDPGLLHLFLFCSIF
jgi:hypothetical protein